MDKTQRKKSFQCHYHQIAQYQGQNDIVEGYIIFFFRMTV